MPESAPRRAHEVGLAEAGGGSPSDPLALITAATSHLERVVAQSPREALPTLVARLSALEAECQRLRALAWTRIMSTKIEERLYSVRDLAARWALSRQRIYELIDTKTLPAVRIDRALRVRHRDVLAFEAARSTTCQGTSLSARMDA